jgi:hypothetical protein
MHARCTHNRVAGLGQGTDYAGWVQLSRTVRIDPALYIYIYIYIIDLFTSIKVKNIIFFITQYFPTPKLEIFIDEYSLTPKLETLWKDHKNRTKTIY